MSAKIDWKNHFIEFILVTLGILIAFGLNTCNENRKEKNQTSLYLEGLKEELLDNKKELDEALPYHKELLKNLREDPLNTNLTMNPARVNNAAWELAENETFKKHVDHELYKKLAKDYQMHESLIWQHQVGSDRMSELNVLGPLYTSDLYGKNLTEEEERALDGAVRQGWIPIFETWTATEAMYLKRIEEALEVLQK